jgi:hypothetical protein
MPIYVGACGPFVDATRFWYPGLLAIVSSNGDGGYDDAENCLPAPRAHAPHPRTAAAAAAAFRRVLLFFFSRFYGVLWL